jgi:hypothetical protein
MIVDNYGGTLISVSVPTAGQFISLSTNNLQLNAGTDSAFAWEPGEGRRVYLQIETVTPLVDAGGGAVAVANFAMCISDASNLVGNTQFIGQSGGVLVAQAIPLIGWTAADFATQGYNVAGANFVIDIPGYNYSKIYLQRALPWFGLCLTVPNHAVGGNTGFSAGAFRARLVVDPSRDNTNRLVQSRMPV